MQYKCPVCNSDSYRLKSVYAGFSRGFTGKSVVECKGCDFLSIFPLPIEEELNAYYNSYWESRGGIENKMPLFKAQAQARFEFLAPFIPKDLTLKVLDVGAGLGFFYDALFGNLNRREISYNVVEPDSSAIDILKSRIKGVNVLPESEGLKEKFHLILLSHLLEHVRDPLEFISGFKDKLCNGSLIFVEVPNQDYLFKAKNEPHLSFFEPKTLSRLIEEAGFRVIKMDTCGVRLSDLVSRKTPKSFKQDFFGRAFRKVQDKINAGLRNSAGINQVFEYGPERRWIRLIAKEKI